MIIYLIIIALLIFIDQWSKKIAFEYMTSRIYPVKKGLVTLITAKNEGATLGLLRNRKKLLITLVMLMMVLIVYYFVISFRAGYPSEVKLGIALVIGGAAGNLIDRVKFQYVRDFFSFNFKKSPIFNIADMFIFVGAVIVVLFV